MRSVVPQTGPAANVPQIKVHDVLLEVNGTDARRSHDELRRALDTGNSYATLKLRKAESKPTSSTTPASPAYPTGGRPAPKEDEPYGSFLPCCMRRF